MSAGLRAPRQALACLAIAAAIVLPATPAGAHAADTPVSTDYRTRVLAVDPPVPGLSVRAASAGTELEVRNETGRTITVVGYSGEPYPPLRPDGVWENTRSPALYANASLHGAPIPDTADAAAEPVWRKRSSNRWVRWHDHRSHWMSLTPPPLARTDPGHVHRIADWTVPLRDGGGAVAVHGTLDWLPPPATSTWWVGIGLAGAGIAVFGARRPAAVWPLGVVAVIGGLAAIGYAVAVSVDIATPGVPALLVQLVGLQIWTLLSGVAAVAAGLYAIARRPAADFGLALTGLIMVVMAGVAQTPVFNHSVATIPADGWWARACVATIIAAGLGTAVAGALRFRRPVPEPA